LVSHISSDIHQAEIAIKLAEAAQAEAIKERQLAKEDPVAESTETSAAPSGNTTAGSSNQTSSGNTTSNSSTE
jgi:hypothetical protein